MQEITMARDSILGQIIADYPQESRRFLSFSVGGDLPLYRGMIKGWEMKSDGTLTVCFDWDTWQED